MWQDSTGLCRPRPNPVLGLTEPSSVDRRASVSVNAKLMQSSTGKINTAPSVGSSSSRCTRAEISQPAGCSTKHFTRRPTVEAAWHTLLVITEFADKCVQEQAPCIQIINYIRPPASKFVSTRRQRFFQSKATATVVTVDGRNLTTLRLRWRRRRNWYEKLQDSTCQLVAVLNLCR